ncbi:hypothetical protein V6B08_07325 [Ferrovibrio sp. MS7]|jgi:predicted transcriptional regulator|uniref:hypothetical protein n=1 Tax=Ferrovibrio TaxID=1231242 RepID=UPI0031370AB1
MLIAPIRQDNRLYFPKDSHDQVIQWCRVKGITLDDFALQVGVPRANLVNILKGIDATPTRVAQAINDVLRS